MNAYQFLEGKTILNIQRIDNSIDYEYFSPYALIFSLNNLDKKFIISATNDGHSIELKLQTVDEIEEDYGFQFNESYLNNLKVDDQLQSFLTNRIEKLRIAEFIEPEIKGDGFILINGSFAGVELTSSKHKIAFHNNYGGWLEVDENESLFPNRERWEWK